MSEYIPSTDEIRDAWAGAKGGYENEPRYRAREAEFDCWLAQYTAEVRAAALDTYSPEKDERLVRYMAMTTPLGYQSALTVVQEMTKLLAAEEIARASRARRARQ